MAYFVATRNGRWEIRESRVTEAGPRSKTLASFRELTDEAIERAIARASAPLTSSELRRAALCAGAPLAEPQADTSARELLRGLLEGKRPRRALRRLVVEAAAEPTGGLSDAALAAGMWLSADARRRGDALIDLLLLADRLPAPPPRRAPLGLRAGPA